MIAPNASVQRLSTRHALTDGAPLPLEGWRVEAARAGGRSDSLYRQPDRVPATQAQRRDSPCRSPLRQRIE